MKMYLDEKFGELNIVFSMAELRSRYPAAAKRLVACMVEAETDSGSSQADIEWIEAQAWALETVDMVIYTSTASDEEIIGYFDYLSIDGFPFSGSCFIGYFEWKPNIYTFFKTIAENFQSDKKEEKQ